MKPGIAQKIYLYVAVLATVIIGMSVSTWIAVHEIKVINTRFEVVEMPLATKTARLKFAIIQVQQWLTDIIATRGLDGLDDGFDQAARYASEVESLLGQMAAIDPAREPEYRELLSGFNEFYSAGKAMAEAYMKGGPQLGNLIMANFDSTAEHLSEQLEPVIESAVSNSSTHLRQ